MASRLPVLKILKKEVTLPVSKLTVKFRPFTVGEQREIVLVKTKTKDDSESIVAAMPILQKCVEGVDIQKLSMFDFQKLFFEIRNSSEGADLNFKIDCEGCKQKSSATINLRDDLTIVNADVTEKEIQIPGQEISLVVSYPNVIELLRARSGAGSEEERAFNMIPSCIRAIKTESENLTDFSKEELDEFVNQLDADVFVKIVEFIKNGPAYESTKPIKCEWCGHEHNLTKEEVASFFS